MWGEGRWGYPDSNQSLGDEEGGGVGDTPLHAYILDHFAGVPFNKKGGKLKFNKRMQA